MANEKEAVKIGFFCVVYNVLMLAFFLPAFKMTSEWTEESVAQQFFYSNSFNQIKLEWNKSMYRSLRVTNETKCEAIEETVFTRPWNGADVGCDCIGVFYNRYDMYGRDNRVNRGISCSKNMTRERCVEEIPV